MGICAFKSKHGLFQMCMLVVFCNYDLELSKILRICRKEPEIDTTQVTFFFVSSAVFLRCSLKHSAFTTVKLSELTLFLKCITSNL